MSKRSILLVVPTSCNALVVVISDGSRRNDLGSLCGQRGAGILLVSLFVVLVIIALTLVVFVFRSVLIRHVLVVLGSGSGSGSGAIGGCAVLVRRDVVRWRRLYLFLGRGLICTSSLAGWFGGRVSRRRERGLFGRTCDAVLLVVGGGFFLVVLLPVFLASDVIFLIFLVFYVSARG